MYEELIYVTDLPYVVVGHGGEGTRRAHSDGGMNVKGFRLA